MKAIIRNKKNKILKTIDDNNLGSLVRIFLSSIFIIFVFYSLPLVLNFTNDNILNTKEFRNNSKTVSNSGSFEITNKDDVKNELISNLMSVNGVEGIFLSKDFISINKYDDVSWDEIKHIIISLINDFYSNGKEFVIDKSPYEINENLGDIEKKIIKILDEKIRPAVAKDGGDIRFKEYKDGVVKVQLQGSCSGCPSSTMTLKQGVQNLLCHYLPEVKEVVAI